MIAMTELGQPEPWMQDAQCAQTDPEAFFPEKGGTNAPGKRVCGSCDVRAECLAFALENNERFGIWGGKSERERRKLAKNRKRSCGVCGTDLTDSAPGTRFCEPCGVARRAQKQHEYSRKKRAAA